MCVLHVYTRNLIIIPPTSSTCHGVKNCWCISYCLGEGLWWFWRTLNVFISVSWADDYYLNFKLFSGLHSIVLKCRKKLVKLVLREVEKEEEIMMMMITLSSFHSIPFLFHFSLFPHSFYSQSHPTFPITPSSPARFHFSTHSLSLALSILLTT